MLSVPFPSSPMFFAKISLNISSTGFERLLTLSSESKAFILVSSLSIHYSFVRQSQIPSQASIINISFESLDLVITSGHGVTACSYGDRSFLSLYSRSPKALLSARDPSTRSIITL